MGSRIARKLRGRGGETIGETLVALLISSLALVMLAGALSTATRLIVTSKEKMSEYYVADSNLVKRNASNATITVTLSSADISQTFEAPCYVNKAFGRVSVYAYGGSGSDS